MSGVALYERTEALEIVRGLLEESEGELTPEIEELLALAELDFAMKAERVALFVREQIATAEAIKAEHDRLGKRMKALTNSADGLKRYLQAQLELAGKEHVKGTLVTIALQKNPPSVQVSVPTEALPVEFVTIVPETRNPNKRALLDAFKAGTALPAGVEITQSTSLRIR